MRLSIALLTLLCVPQASAQIVQLDIDINDGATGKATAVCIGPTPTGSVFLTARHNFRDAHSARVLIDDQWHRVATVNESRTADVASFEVETQCPAIPLAERIDYEQPCRLAGYGPHFNSTDEGGSFNGIIYPDRIQGNDGLHPVVGDSGGPVEQSGKVVGIISGFVETMHRSDNAARAYPTVYVDLSDCCECLQQVYGQCPPGGCPIYVRPRIRQPWAGIGIGIPVGPPRIEYQVVPPPRQPQPVRPPEQAFIPGPAGPPGRDGKDGKDGRSVRREDVEAAVWAWLDSNAERLRGPAGKDGLNGRDGEPGAPGPPGTSVNLDSVSERLRAVENRKIRVVTSDGRAVVDDEKYSGSDSDPIVIRVNKLTNER